MMKENALNFQKSGIMYSFQVVKAKYSRPLRYVLSFLLGVSMLLFFVTSGGSIYTDSQIGFIFTLITAAIIMNIISANFIDKVYAIGSLEMDDKKMYIQTDEINQEIYLKDINLIKLMAGTVNNKSYKSSTTLIASIVFREVKVLNVHITREHFEDNKKQRKFFWNKNMDLFDLLTKNNIKFEVDNSLKEKDCVKN